MTPIPTHIGRYEVKSELGRGGMATVYQAHDPSFDREVAIKMLPQQFLHDPQFRIRFEREVKTIAQMEHPSIVPVYDVGEDNGQPYFVMRNMTGGSLEERIKKGAFSVQDTARLVTRLARGLVYAHKKGIVHRDLKPGNVLFDEGGDAFISDFGLAKLMDAAPNMTGSGVIGTPAYMSPEQAQGSNVDGRSDIYALGAIIYEMLSGEHPYKANTPMGVVLKHITDPVPEIRRDHPNIPAEVDEIIKKAMNKNPDKRYATATDLSQALNQAAFGETDASKKSPSSGILSGGLTRNKKNIWIGVIVLALIFLAVAVNLLLGKPASAPAPDATFTPAASRASETALPSTATLPPPTATVAEITPTLIPSATPLPPGALDKIAFLSANDVWWMNPDGSAASPLSGDAAPKEKLAWLPDGKTLTYLRGTCVYLLDVETRLATRVNCFNAERLDGFRVSPDGKRAAISIDLQLIIVPFNAEAIGRAGNRIALSRIEGACVYNRHSVKDVRWSRDGKKLAFIYLDTTAQPVDQIQFMDVSACPPAAPASLGALPGNTFVIEGFDESGELPSFDWDGERRFVFNDFVRNEGFGNLYYFDSKTGQGGKVNPLQGKCCYRDARFSPDGKYVLFAFQDMSLGQKAVIQLYFVEFDKLIQGEAGEPLALPIGLFPDPRSAPQPALRLIP
ncbi:MAG: Serine/threonine-protein kinase PknD [Anaerolineales bacterium]|nr:Serine/threonine-protein kinase PknD [Anaerolineales bacterium]